MTPEQWAALIAALGVGTFLRDFASAIWKWITGRASRQLDVVAKERERADRAVEEMDELDRKLDKSTMRARVAVEYAANLRRDQIERCNAKPEDLRPWPDILVN